MIKIMLHVGWVSYLKSWIKCLMIKNKVIAATPVMRWILTSVYEKCK